MAKRYADDELNYVDLDDDKIYIHQVEIYIYNN